MSARARNYERRSSTALRSAFVALSIFLAVSAGGSQPASAHAGLNELIQQLSDLLAQRPGDPELLLKRARLHLEHGDRDLAMADIGAAAAITGPREAAYLRGLYHLDAHDYRAAVSAFSEYLDLHPGHIPSLHKRAIAYGQLGQPPQSIRDYRRLLEVSRSPSPDYYLELAAIEANVPPDGLQRALQSLDRGIARLGPLVSLQQTAIGYELARHDYTAALHRHQTLQPWLGKTRQWQELNRQLSARTQTKVDSEILPQGATPRATSD